jgi:hypothetical protein
MPQGPKGEKRPANVIGRHYFQFLPNGKKEVSN